MILKSKRLILKLFFILFVSQSLCFDSLNSFDNNICNTAYLNGI